MSTLRGFLNSSIGSKMAMAATGLGLFGFLMAHVMGNLLVFAGPDAINAYAQGLRKLPYGGLWVMRGGLIVCAILHFAIGIRVTLANRAARPVQYTSKAPIQASAASRSMIWTGLALLFYLAFHLLHLTFHVAGNPVVKEDALGRTDVYAMLLATFHDPWIALTYIAAMVFLALHLSHGLSSLFQTFGLNNKRLAGLVRLIGPAAASAVAAAYISIPVCIWLGFLGP